MARDLHLILLIQTGGREVLPVIPSEDGIQFFLHFLDPGLRRGDSRLVCDLNSTALGATPRHNIDSDRIAKDSRDGFQQRPTCRILPDVPTNEVEKGAARLRGKSTRPGKRATGNVSVMALVASSTMKQRCTQSRILCARSE